LSKILPSTLSFHRKTITTLSFSPDGKYVVTGEVSIQYLCFVVASQEVRSSGSVSHADVAGLVWK